MSLKLLSTKEGSDCIARGVPHRLTRGPAVLTVPNRPPLPHQLATRHLARTPAQDLTSCGCRSACQRVLRCSMLRSVSVSVLLTRTLGESDFPSS